MSGEEESTMESVSLGQTNGYNEMESYSKWSESGGNEGLCFNPCTEARLYASSIISDVGADELSPISELKPATSIMIYDKKESDVDDDSACYTDDNSSRISDAISFHSNQTSCYSTDPKFQENETDSVTTPANYYIVTPLPREPSPTPSEIGELQLKSSLHSTKGESQQHPQPTKKKKKEKPVMRKVKKKVNKDGAVELVYGNKAHLKSLGMPKSAKPLERVKTLTRMATFSKRAHIASPLTIQGSADDTKSLSDTGSCKDDEDVKEKSNTEVGKSRKKPKESMEEEKKLKKANAKEEKKSMEEEKMLKKAMAKEEKKAMKEEKKLKKTKAKEEKKLQKGEHTEEESYSKKDDQVAKKQENAQAIQVMMTTGEVARKSQNRKNHLTKLIDSVAMCSGQLAQRSVLDLYEDRDQEESTEVLYKFGSTFVQANPEEICRIEADKKEEEDTNRPRDKVTAKEKKAEKKKAAKAAMKLKKKEEATAKKEQKAKKKSEKMLQAQMKNAQKKQEKKRKAEAKRERKESKISKKKKEENEETIQDLPEANDLIQAPSFEITKEKSQKEGRWGLPRSNTFKMRRRSLSPSVNSVNIVVNVQEVWRSM